jgi:hypothetical protein
MEPTLANRLPRNKEDIDDGHCSTGHRLYNQHLTMV